ncbi:hypothetical protein A9K65_014030 [Mesorhizobium sp. WSM1497]|uniref:DUF3618 domain-containing protein n=1 Tax=Mesorhizobium sp. WSM1497 TaxID=278153 RepID=UPI0007ECA96A|nr:DUF3618 domain-containing protein [Mesorhizobium sp. WSM1497]ARP64369.1 hypothetical protein A9K65_014030 [Mesorhizobium sp. WSM1497]
MTDKSAAELEREAEATRARVVATAESIRGKMTPGQLFDEFTGHFSGGTGSEMLNNLKAQVRDNPLPLTMIGAGFAWLMLGRGASPGTADFGHATPRGWGERDGASGTGLAAMTSDTAASVTEAAGGAAETLSEMASRVAGTASGVASSAAATASDMANSAAATASDMANTASDTLTQSAATAADIATKARRSAQQLMEDQPFVLAAVGLAVGAAIGAMLPHTQIEDERLGGYGEKLRDKAEDAVEKGVDQAKQVAVEAYHTATDEAGRQASGEGTLADKVSKVVKSGAERTENTIRQRLARPEESGEAGVGQKSRGGKPKA